MKKVSLMFFVSLCFGVIAVLLWTGTAHAKKTAKPPSCNAAVQIFPGDGYPSPDDFDVSGHGPALNYEDNEDGTFTDCNTKYMWEKKLADDGSDGGDCEEVDQADRSAHCVNNTYRWSDAGSAANGKLFTDFLVKLNDRCDGDETKPCTTDADCGVDGPCGFAGFRDWCIPNVKKLQSIVDYSTCNGCNGGTAASSVPGSTAASLYWSATTFADDPGDAWVVGFLNGFVDVGGKSSGGGPGIGHARALRPCE